jgi:hypothetical protein
MIIDTRLLRRIGKRANRVKFGKQPNGTLLSVAMSPSRWEQSCPGTEDYELKKSIMVTVNLPATWLIVRTPGCLKDKSDRWSAARELTNLILSISYLDR